MSARDVLQKWQYPTSADDPAVPEHARRGFEPAHRAWGSGDPDVLFQGQQQTTTPWPRLSQSKSTWPYDRQLVAQELAKPPEITEVDPRNLHATQPKVTRGGVDYYMGDEYHKTGTTYADQDRASNRWPVVYARDDGTNILLSGHHRATSSILNGRQLQARQIRGPMGPPR